MESVDHGSKDISATKCDVTAKEKPVEIHLEKLVEIVGAGRERCDFATPVVITKIEKDEKDKKDEKNKNDEKDNKDETDKEDKNEEEERCNFATPVVITKIEKGKKRDDGRGENIRRDTFNNTKNLTANETEEVNASSTNQTNVTEPKIENTGAGKEYHGKPNMVVETAKVIEDLDLLLAVEKCACTATDQVPVLVFDHLNRKEALENDMVGVKEEVELEENDTHLNIFKIDLDKLEVIEFGQEEEPKVNIFKVDQS